MTVTAAAAASAGHMAHHGNGGGGSGMNGPFAVSFLLHAVVIVLAIVGMPYFKRDIPPELAEPVSVEIVTVSDKTRTNRAPVEMPRPEEIKKETPPPPKPVAPKSAPAAPPDSSQLEALKPPEKIEEIKESDVPLPKPLPNKKPPPPKKAEQKKIAPNKLADEKKPQDDAFAKLLKQLDPTAGQPAPPKTLTDPAANAAPQPSPIADLSDQMTMSEMDALKHQLAQCWNVPMGVEYAENQTVDVRLTVNPDRTVQNAGLANVSDQIRYNSDSAFRAAADAALRAVYNPSCNPLELPPGKYAQWNVMTITFDPRTMLQ